MSTAYRKEWKNEHLVANRPERLIDGGGISAESRAQLQGAATVADVVAWLQRVLLGQENA